MPVVPGVVQGALRGNRRWFGVRRSDHGFVTGFGGSVPRAGVCSLYRDGGHRRKDGRRAKKGQVDGPAYGVTADGCNACSGGASSVVTITVASITSAAIRSVGVFGYSDYWRDRDRLGRFRGS